MTKIPHNIAFLTVLCVLLVMSCTHAERPGKTIVARIIVKFADPVQPPDALSIRLSGGAVLLRHERAMSGESHLYSGLVSKKTLKRTVRALNERADVDYAQADRTFSY